MTRHVLELIHGNRPWQYPKNYKKQILGNKTESDTLHRPTEDSRMSKAQTGQKTEIELIVKNSDEK